MVVEDARNGAGVQDRDDHVSGLWHAIQEGNPPWDVAYFAVLAVAQGVIRKYPVHVADLGWIELPAVELTHSFFAVRDYANILATLAGKAVTQESFRRLLRRTLTNFLIELHRQTPAGKVGRRLIGVLSEIGAVATNGSSWALPHHASGTWDEDEEALLRAAYEVAYESVEYDSERRESPVLSNQSLREMLTVVLEAAGGPVPLAALVRVISQRTGLGVMPTLTEMDDDVYQVIDGFESPEEIALARETVTQILDALNEKQLIALRHRDLTVRELAEVLGVSRSSAQAVREDLRSLAAEHLRDTDTRALRLLDEELEKRLGQG